MILQVHEQPVHEQVGSRGRESQVKREGQVGQ